jgi:ComF family protein
LCPKCQQQPPPYDRVIAPWLYDEQMAALMHRWKFHGERYLTPLLAGLWLEQLVEPPIIDVIVPVPLHWWRLCQRGFNQAELLSHEIRHSCPSLHCAEPGHNFVSRRRHTHSQSRLTARGRAQNLTGAFRVRRPCDGLRLAIVDDVMTTGSTAAALAVSLRDAGATSVEVWCIARTPAPPI